VIEPDGDGKLPGERGSMSNDQKPDICVLGGGAGGVDLAAGAAQLGAKIVLVERGRLGGENLNRGTVPSKALISVSRQAHNVRQIREFGIAPMTPVINFRAVADHIQSVVAAVAPNESAERLAGFGVQVLRGFARFESRDSVSVDGRIIKARNFVIATGSSPAIPAIAGLQRVPVLTNETLFTSTTRFEHLIVIGGTGVALELAQAYLRLGSRVTLVAPGRFLPEYDPELSQPLMARMRDEGMVLAEGVSCERIEPTDTGGIRLRASKDGDIETVEASHLLIADGRKPNVDGLQLELAGVTRSGSGIEISQRLRTSNKQIYAIGDVTGGPPYATLARHQADVVVRRLVLGATDIARPESVPLVIFTDPELAHVGMTETQARSRHGDAIRVLRWPFSQNDRAIAERRTDGFAKIVATRAGRILGATIIGAQAGELIQTWSLAVSAALTVAQVSRSVAPYPTYAETSIRAAQGYTLEGAAESGVRSVLRLLPRLG